VVERIFAEQCLGRAAFGSVDSLKYRLGYAFSLAVRDTSSQCAQRVHIFYKSDNLRHKGICGVDGSTKLALSLQDYPNRGFLLSKEQLMLLKVMVILGLILLGTWLARIYPGQDRNSEDDEWEDAPPQRYMEEPAPAPRVRLPR